ncbi:MAG: hypothetical protein M3R47_12130, partial [Chloroflexota bacterium]|nr:hypothetical protein [Chloroflexota bacterium]
RGRSARSAIVPAARPNSSDGSMRAAKISPIANAPPPASSASQAVAVRSMPCAAAEDMLEYQSRRNVGDRKGVMRFPFIIVQIRGKGTRTNTNTGQLAASQSSNVNNMV